jgi:hypothetical protein
MQHGDEYPQRTDQEKCSNCSNVARVALSQKSCYTSDLRHDSSNITVTSAGMKV